ncbi:hypothetical protein HPB50_022047 [Hyalomma asiaticum]|uniref:Uncharacterized protein n=1 Tax=Hyalomma asiaticum TaxID=266040 RepID=A0ACB7S961_HYAAI|nr:hypothetical protein HPB50_022047 [Hyalomma asiaticum]
MDVHVRTNNLSIAPCVCEPYAAAAAPASQEWRLRYAALTTRDPESCRLEPERGLCYAAFTLYYFDAAAGTCEEFLYGGCGGNANRFGSLEECLATCARASDVAAAGDATRKPAQGAHRRRGDASSSSAAVASHANGVAGLQQAAATRPWTTPAHASPELLALNLRREPLSTPDTAAFISPDLLRPADGERVWDAARL